MKSLCGEAPHSKQLSDGHPCWHFGATAVVWETTVQYKSWEISSINKVPPTFFDFVLFKGIFSLKKKSTGILKYYIPLLTVLMTSLISLKSHYILDNFLKYKIRRWSLFFSHVPDFVAKVYFIALLHQKSLRT